MKQSNSHSPGNRHDNEGFHETELQIENKERKEEASYSPSLISMPTPYKTYVEKTKVNLHRAQVLIREVPILEQPAELMTSDVSVVPQTTKMDIQSRMPNEKPKTLYEKYVSSEAYQCLYHKYSRGIKDKMPTADMKKYFSRTHFSTYYVNLDFLTQPQAVHPRNLDQSSFNKLMEQQTDMQFDSRFQCGNLYAVFKVYVGIKQKKNETGVYDLILQNDINTKGYNHWFYFSVRTKKTQSCRFNIVNMIKPWSEFTRGMKPAIFGYRDSLLNKVGWRRDGTILDYCLTQVTRQQTEDRYYCFSFEYGFKHENDLTYFALNIPYSYSRLLAELKKIESAAYKVKQLYFKKENLVRSLSFNECPLITLTMKRSKDDTKRERKKVIVVIARQHPAQTVGSFVMEGCLRYLVSGTEEAISLLHRYIFKIVPMVNVDGVIYGNSRCDINGCDVNRQWSNPNRYFLPIVFNIKSTFEKMIAEGYEIDYFLDLHGHSKKLNSFIYACNDESKSITSRMLPYILSKIQPKFSYEECLFELSKNKRNTARAYFFKLTKNPKSITLENSFFGYNVGDSIKHYSPEDLNDVGYSLMSAIAIQSEYPKTNGSLDLSNAQTDIMTLIEKENNEKHSVAESNVSSESEPYEDELGIEDKEKMVISKSTIGYLNIDYETLDQQSIRKAEKQQQANNKIVKEDNADTNNIKIPKKEVRIRLQKEPFDKKRSLTLERLSLSKHLEPIRTNRLGERHTSRDSMTQRNKVIFTIQVPIRKQPIVSESWRKNIYESLGRNQKKSFWNNFEKQMAEVIQEKLHIEPQEPVPTLPDFFHTSRNVLPYVLERKKNPRGMPLSMSPMKQSPQI